VLNLTPEWLAATGLIVVAAYAVFGLTGFGSGIVAIPLLALFLPLKQAVTLLMLLDIAAGAVLVGRHRWGVRFAEVALITPFMLIGMIAGVLLLVHVSEPALLLALGLFVIAYAVVGLLRSERTPVLARGWGAVLSLVGGALVALYNVGAVLWTVYTSSRIRDKDQLRATTAATLLLSVLMRLVLYGHAGLLEQPEVWLVAGALLVPMLAGYWAGSLLHAKVSQAAFLKGVHVMLVGSGAALVLRAIWTYR
jgi:uncharacterized membrane protein YfcA